MIDPTEMEITAMRSCLKSFGEAAEGIGFDKPLGAYSETEALQVIHAIVAAYVEAMTMAHEAMKHSARPNQQDYDPFDNFNDDLPWETK